MEEEEEDDEEEDGDEEEDPLNIFQKTFHSERQSHSVR